MVPTTDVDASSDESLGPVRHRYIADRLLILLLYRPASEEEGITRLEDGSLLLKMGRLARLLRLNSSRIYDQLLFLEHTGYLAYVDYKFKYGQVRVKPVAPLVTWTAQ